MNISHGKGLSIFLKSIAKKEDRFTDAFLQAQIATTIPKIKYHAAHWFYPTKASR